MAANEHPGCPLGIIGRRDAVHRAASKDSGDGEGHGLTDWRCFYRISSVDGIRRRLQDQLIKREVEPAAEFEAGLSDGAAMGETGALVQADAEGVGGVDAA